MRSTSSSDLPSDIAQLLRVGANDGPSIDEALALLARLRTSPNQARALDELVARAVVNPLPPPLALAVASAMVERGESDRALKVLEGATSSDALLVSADLYAERGDLTTAVALVERVLSRDLDHPGARERHQKWRVAKGLADFRFGMPAFDGWPAIRHGQHLLRHA